MRRMQLLLPLIVTVLFLSLSCGKRTPQATRTPESGRTPTTVTTSTARPSPSPYTPTATAPSVATPAPTAQGTVVPPTPGSTARVDLKPNPDPPAGIILLKDVRTGVQPDEGVDRIVFEFSSGIPAGSIEYVPDVAQCASGMPVTLAGQAILLVRFTGTDAHDNGQPTIPATQLRGPGTTIPEAKQVCDFEAHVNWAIGVKSTQPFRVIQLSSPFRVVIDIKQ